MKTFLSTVAVLMVLLGSGWLFAPDAMLAQWGVHSDATGAYVGRRYGAILFGYAAILWLARSAAPSAARAAILGGGVLVTVLITCVSLAGVLTSTIGPGAWGAVVIEALLSGGFLYYYLAERKQAQVPSRQP
jgi:hypothetical protein